MHRISLDFYLDRQSPIHHWPAVAKLVMALIVVIGTALAPRSLWGLFSFIAAVLLFIVALSHLPLKRILSRVLILEPAGRRSGIVVLFPAPGIGSFPWPHRQEHTLSCYHDHTVRDPRPFQICLQHFANCAFRVF